MPHNLETWKDKALFTPGPLTTSRTVKEAMLRDMGSRDARFIDVVAEIRQGLLDVAGVSGEVFTAIPMQGSGTFSVEAVLASTIRSEGRVLLVINGAYGHRMAAMCDYLKIDSLRLSFAEDQLPDLPTIKRALAENADIKDVAVVHCETTTGIVNPIAAIGALARDAGARYFVDAMSSFGAIPIDFEAACIDYLVSSANKCIEGVPGFGFTIARKAALLETAGRARSLSLDLLAQWQGLEGNGQFRFTPPTHALLAFHRALQELAAEGGVPGRAARYQSNYETLIAGMGALGFETYLPTALQGPIITSFRYPDHPRWDFEAFYSRLAARDCLIYPGKVSQGDCFRIGTIGRITTADIRALLAAIRDALADMGIELPAAAGEPRTPKS